MTENEYDMSVFELDEIIEGSEVHIKIVAINVGQQTMCAEIVQSSEFWQVRDLPVGLRANMRPGGQQNSWIFDEQRLPWFILDVTGPSHVKNFEYNR